MTGAEVAMMAAAAPEVAALAGTAAAGTAAAAAPAAAATAGAGMGAGLLGGTLGPTMAAAEAGALSAGIPGITGGAGMVGAGATPFVTAGAPGATGLLAPPAASGMGGGASSLFGTGLHANAAGAGGFKMPSGKSMFDAASKMQEMGDQQGMAPAGQRPQQMDSQQLAEIMKRMQMQQGGRSNWAGFLGGF